MFFIRNGDKGGIMGGVPNYLYYKETFKKNNPKPQNNRQLIMQLKGLKGHKESSAVI